MVSSHRGEFGALRAQFSHQLYYVTAAAEDDRGNGDQRVEQLTGRDLSRLEDRVDVFLALKSL